MPKIKKLEPYCPAAELFSLFAEEEDAVFLDSSLKNELGQFSIIGRNPYLRLRKGENFTVNGEISEEPFEAFVKRYLKNNYQENDTKLPITAGAIGYFTYDYGREREGVAAKDEKEVLIPDCILNFYDEFIVEDIRAREVWLICNGNRKNAGEQMAELEERLRAGLSQKENTVPSFSETAPAVHLNFEKEEYKDTIDRMIDYIVEGDIYVANLTQQLRIESGSAPYPVFERLRVNNPSPFGGYFNYGDFQIVSASPERFLRMEKGRVETRPIKGTRRRGRTPKEDALLKQELADSEKDKSELLMIMDLERNDLNRVCKPGSVKVTELFTVETYATVFHLVSNIEGMLRDGLTVMDLIEAAFPGGSITGAPKLRAMEIIDELEHGRRNLYTGSIGYLTLDGNCDFNIVIRTLVHKDGTYYLGAGGGITYESELEFEYEETLQKAQALLAALGGENRCSR